MHRLGIYKPQSLIPALASPASTDAGVSREKSGFMGAHYSAITGTKTASKTDFRVRSRRYITVCQLLAVVRPQSPPMMHNSMSAECRPSHSRVTSVVGAGPAPAKERQL